MAFVWGAETQFEPGAAQLMTCCRIDKDKFVVAWQDPVTMFGVAIVGVVTGLNIAWGPISAAFSVGVLTGSAIHICPLDTDKFAVVYGDNALGADGYTRVGIVTGNTIAWGAAVEFQNNNVDRPSCCNIGIDKFGIAYRDNNNTLGLVCICSVVGNVITAGAPIQLEAPGQTNQFSCLRWEDDKFIVAYKTRTLGLDIRVITVAGLVPTCHTTTTFSVAASSVVYPDSLAKISTNSFAVCWIETGPQLQQVCVGTVTGNTITQGPVTLLDNIDNEYSCVNALTSDSFVVLYPDRNFARRGTYNICTFVGTTITDKGKVAWRQPAIPGPTNMLSSSVINGKFVAAFRDAAVGGRGVVCKFLNPPTVTTDPATGVN